MRRPARDLALIAVFAGIVAALGIVPALQPPGFSVPITAQTLGVILAGSILGARRGFWALTLFVGLVAVGLPLLAGGRGGLGVFAGASVGFLISFPFAAFVIGWLTERGGTTYRLAWGIVANLLGGIVVMYAGGIIGMALILDLSIRTATILNWIYLPGDVVKVIVAAFVAQGVHAAYPGLIDRPVRSRQPETSAA